MAFIASFGEICRDMAFAAPVSRGNFYYHDGLYVDVGNLNRHKRASVEEIRTILRPDLKKSKTTSPAPSKDQVGHWYEAQLIHYGLPPSKDKARAKMRLLEALNSSRLAVPPNVAQMEAEMKKEYAAAERKAKAEIKNSSMPKRKEESVVVGKKRKQANEHDSTADAANSQPQAKKGKKVQSDSSKPKAEKAMTLKPSKKTTESKAKQSLSQRGEREQPKQTARKGPIQTAKSSKLHAAWVEDPTRGPGPINPATGARYAHPSEMSTSMAAVEEMISLPPSQPKTKARRDLEAAAKRERDRKKLSVKGEPKLKKETKIKNESSTSPSSQIRAGPTENLSCSPNGPSLGLINGIYDLYNQDMVDQFGTRNLTLTLTLDGTTIWGAYDFGIYTGIFFFPDRPWRASNEPLPFTWRARGRPDTWGSRNSKGEMISAYDCFGEISFLGSGVIEGSISDVGRLYFEGRRRQEAGTAVRSAKSMQEEWEEYTEEAGWAEQYGYDRDSYE